MKAASEWVFTGNSSPAAFLSHSLTRTFRPWRRPVRYFVLRPHIEYFPVYFYSSVKLVMELGLLWPLTCFPQFKESELRLLLTLLCEGFMHQSVCFLQTLQENSPRDNLLFFILRSRGLGLTLLNYLKPSIGYSVSNLISISIGYESKLEIRKQNIATGGYLSMMNSHSIRLQILTSYCSEGSR